MIRKAEGKQKGKITRRRVLNVVAVGAASGLVCSYPMIWAQDIQDVTLVHASGSDAAIKVVADRASKDLGFKTRPQAVSDEVQLSRSLTQPKSIDITNIDNVKMPYLVGNGVLAPTPMAKYEYWTSTVSLHQERLRNGKQASNQGLSPAEAMLFPTIYNADTLGIRPDLIGDRDKVTSWRDLLDPHFNGKAALFDYAPLGVIDVAMALEAPTDVKYADKGNIR
jgi:putative spermidine/putrescine transport system substrate-binding protein